MKKKPKMLRAFLIKPKEREVVEIEYTQGGFAVKDGAYEVTGHSILQAAPVSNCMADNRIAKVLKRATLWVDEEGWLKKEEDIHIFRIAGFSHQQKIAGNALLCFASRSMPAEITLEVVKRLVAFY